MSKIIAILLLLAGSAWADRYAVATRSNATMRSEMVLETNVLKAQFWLPFDRPPSDYAAWKVLDYSTNRLTCTNTTATWIAGMAGQAQRYTNANYTRLPSGPFLVGTNDFTLALQFRPDYATSAVGTTIFSSGNQAGSNALFTVATIATMTPRIFTRDAEGTSLIITHTTAMTSGTWYNVFYSRTGTQNVFGVALTNAGLVLITSNATPVNLIGTNYTFGANFRTDPDTVNTPTTGAVDNAIFVMPSIPVADVSNFFNKGHGASAP